MAVAESPLESTRLGGTMERQPVSSSNLASVGYDPNSEILEIEFRDGGVYQYYSVPQFVYDRLMTAGSLGQFFNSQVKGLYHYSRI